MMNFVERIVRKLNCEIDCRSLGRGRCGLIVMILTDLRNCLECMWSEDEWRKWNVRKLEKDGIKYEEWSIGFKKRMEK